MQFTLAKLLWLANIGAEKTYKGVLILAGVFAIIFAIYTIAYQGCCASAHLGSLLLSAENISLSMTWGIILGGCFCSAESAPFPSGLPIFGCWGALALGQGITLMLLHLLSAKASV